MNRQKEFDIKIADYFDDKMSAEQEEAFMQELDDSDDLREKYEEELTIRSVLGTRTSNEKKAQVGNVISVNPQAGINALGSKNNTPVIPIYRSISSIAAAVILIVAGAALFIIFKNNNSAGPTAAGIPASKDTTKITDSHNLLAPLPNNAEIAANAFGKFYKPYASSNDPVEVSEYLQDYKQGRYADVTKATEADLQQMGVNDHGQGLMQYLQLYKGLAYLAQNNTGGALLKFDSVLNTAHKDEPQYYHTQWYSCLALLKQGDISKASNIAGIIVQSKSPYKKEAGELLKELGVK